MQRPLKTWILGLVGLGPLLAGQLDPRLQKLVREWKQNRETFQQTFTTGNWAARQGVRNAGAGYMASVTLSGSFEVLDELGIPYTLIVPGVATAEVPVDLVGRLEADARIKHVKLAHLVEPLNDLANAKIKSGVMHTAGYTGSGVLVGIVDTGIDVVHPAFRQNGQVGAPSRIKFLWDQTAASTPFSVGSFSTTLGRRWTDTEINAGSCTETDTNGHGTHVAGSFAGYDSAWTARQGASTGSNILFVKTTMKSSDVLSGIKFLYEQAKALGKPIVVNLSLGSKYGPHDGSDTDTKTIDDLIASSNGNLIVVRAGGNYANDGHHWSGTAATTAASAPLTVSSYTPAAGGNVLAFQFFYDATQAVSLRFKDTAGAYTNWIPADGVAKAGTMTDGAGYYVINAQTPESYNSGLKQIYVELGEAADGDGKQPRQGAYALELKTDSGSTRVDGWLFYGGVPAYFNPYDPAITLGNDGCGRNSVVVSNYVSRKSWLASDGLTYTSKSFIQDDIASSSSIGPTRDARQKPDVTAPGTMILSTRSSVVSPDANVLPPDGTAYYQFMSGTSMASPCAAGSIALLKEAHPTWTFSEVIGYFKTNSQNTAVHTTAGTWDATWGWGVVDLSKGANVGPAFTTQPLSQSVALGATVSFTVAVTGGQTPYTYQWKRGTTTVGGNSATLTLSNVQQADAGSYTCTVTDSSATPLSVTSNAATLSLLIPTIALTPTTVSVLGGTAQGFTATLTNGSTNKLNWTATGGTLASAQTTTASANNTWTAPIPASTTTYTLTVTTVDLPVDTKTATITVVPPSAISLVMATPTRTMLAGETFSFSVSGDAGQGVTWTKSAALSATGTGLTYTVTTPTTTPLTAQTYTVTATSALDTTKSATSTITVKGLDLSGDSTLDVRDLLNFGAHWGNNAADPANFKGTGTVDADDLTYLLGKL